MSTYKEIFGKPIKVLASDPTDTGAEGQIWYNTTLNNFRTVLNSAAWSSSAPLIQTRGQVTMFGIQTSSVVAGGSGPGATMYNDTEEYNGSGWSAGGDLNTTREGSHGAGVLTAGVIVGGFIEPTTYSNAAEEYDGSAWTSVTVTPYAVNNMAAFGTQTASMFAGGDPGSKTTTLEYGGSGSWTAGGALGTGRAQQGGACLAPLSAGLIWGGTPLSTAVEEYNGTSWTAGNVLPAGVQFGGGAGTQTAALSFGNFSGPTTITTATTKYDGTSWTATGSLGIAQARSQGSGSQALALVAGGDYPHTTPVATTQEFNISSSVITPGAWASGTVYPVPIQDTTGAGTTTAAIYYGGYSTPDGHTAKCNEYNGSSWTATPDLNSGRVLYQTGTGTQTAALAASGANPALSPNPTAASEEWNGASWTSGNSMNDARSGGVIGGTQTSAIAAGGSIPAPTPPSNSDKAESYNGTSWTIETVTPTILFGGKGFSGQSETSNIFIGVGASSEDTFSYDGTSWSDLSKTLVSGQNTLAAGSQQGTSTAAIIAGGFNPSPAIVATGQQYDGSAWATAPSLGTGRRGGGAAGSATSCMGVGGETPSRTNACEEFTSETTALNYKTITTS